MHLERNKSPHFGSRQIWQDSGNAGAGVGVDRVREFDAGSLQIA